jgi:tryptophanyl-tRNA synthetase
METDRVRILTGDRPTGRMHLGHFVGSLRNRIRLQDEYECFFIIADLHTLTTRPDKSAIASLGKNVRELVLDYLSVGIDPERSVIFLQSGVQETYELNLIFEMLVSVPRLERDILLPRATLVPVGRDNQAHVEVTREIARRFNRLYGQVFALPEALIGEVPSLVGIDGKTQMSKSRGNTIDLADDSETVTAKVMQMFTDPKRVRADIPGRVDGNPIFIYHDAFNPDKEQVAELKEQYQKGKVGDVEVKRHLASALNAFLEPIRERRAHFLAVLSLVEDILIAGTEQMRAEARETMALVREAMGMYRLPTAG